MNDKGIVATATLVTSLLSYFYAREAQKDAVPFVMVGGFLGSIIGETIVEAVKKHKSDNENTKNGN